MSQRISNAVVSSVSTDGAGGDVLVEWIDPAGPAINFRLTVDGPSGVSEQQVVLPITVTPSFTVT